MKHILTRKKPSESPWNARNVLSISKLPGLLLWVFAGLMSLTILGRILFDQGVPYAPDPSAFFKMTSDVAEAMAGHLSWSEMLRQTAERTVTYMFPVAILAALTGFRSPEFYMTVGWLLYVLPLPFLYLSLVRAFRAPAVVDYAMAALFLAITPLLNLGVLYFTDVPSLTIAFAGLVCLAHGLNRASIWRMSLGFFLLAMAVTVRITNVVPYFMAMLLLSWLMWSRVKAVWAEIVKAIAIAISATLLAEAVFRFDISFVYLWQSDQKLESSIWKYGTGNSEYGIENLFAFRFWRFLATAVLWLPLFIIIHTTGLFAGHVRIPGESESRRPWFAIAALMGLIIFCAYTAKLQPLNPRYVMPALLLIAPVLAATALPKQASTLMAALCFLFCADTLYYHWGRQGQAAPLSITLTRLAYTIDSVDALWTKPIGLHAGRDKIDITPNLVNALLAAGAEDRPVSIGVLALDGQLFREEYLRFYLTYMSPTMEAYRNIWIAGWHPFSEFGVREIYNKFVPQNAMAFANADFIVVPTDEDRPRLNASFWVEKDLVGDVRRAAQKGQDATLGLANVATLTGAFRDQTKDIAIRYNLYEVVDSRAWASAVKKRFCAIRGIGDAIFSLWCGTISPEGESRNIPVSPVALASSASIIESAQGPILKLDLKWPPKSGFSRIYVHFLPQPSPSGNCPFFTADHDPLEKTSDEDYTALPIERLPSIRSCQYVLNVGARVDAIARDIFDASEIEGMVKP